VSLVELVRQRRAHGLIVAASEWQLQDRDLEEERRLCLSMLGTLQVRLGPRSPGNDNAGNTSSRQQKKISLGCIGEKVKKRNKQLISNGVVGIELKWP
jgi:hypothetical protein